MKKRPKRQTPEEAAVHDAVVEELESRIAALTGELKAAGSVYAKVGRGDQLGFALGRIEAELGAKNEPA